MSNHMEFENKFKNVLIWNKPEEAEEEREKAGKDEALRDEAGGYNNIKLSGQCSSSGVLG